MADVSSVNCSSISLKLDDLEFPIHKYSFNGNKKQIKVCLKEGFDINFPNANGFTPLYLSVLGGHKKSAKLLIKMGADPNRRTFNGLTALHAAAQFGDAELLNLLIAAGGDLRLHDYNLHSVLDYAQQNKDAKSRHNIVHLIQVTTHDAIVGPQVDYLETTAIFNKRQKGNKFSFSSLFGKKCDGLGNCTMIADGFGKVVVQRDESCSLFKNYPLISVNDLDHDDDAHTWENGPHFVMEGMFWNGEPITVKRIHTNPKKSTCIDFIIEELNNLLKLQNNSILTLIGASRDQFAENQVLVFERVTYGSMFDYLHTQRNSLSHDQLAVIMKQISCALRYLHRNRFVHCSVTSHAIFLTDDYHAKLGNFEYMNALDSPQPCQVVLNRYLNSTYNWMAPEVMEGLKPTPMSDVYSYASVFWEATQGCIPWANIPFNLIYDKVVNGKWNCLAFEAISSQNAIVVPDSFLDIISNGMQHNPLSRMNILKIEKILSVYIENNSCCPPTFEKPAFEGFNMFNSLLCCDGGDEILSNTLSFPSHQSFVYGRYHQPYTKYLDKNITGRRKWIDNRTSVKHDAIQMKKSFVSHPNKDNSDAKPLQNVQQNSSPKSHLKTVFSEVGFDATNSPNKIFGGNARTGEKEEEMKNISESHVANERHFRLMDNVTFNSNEQCFDVEKKQEFKLCDVIDVEMAKPNNKICFNSPHSSSKNFLCNEIKISDEITRNCLSDEGGTESSFNIASKHRAVDNQVLEVARTSSEPEQLYDSHETIISSLVGTDNALQRRSLTQTYKIDFLKIEGISTCEEISNQLKKRPTIISKEKEKNCSSFQNISSNISESTISNILSKKSFFESKLSTPTFTERSFRRNVTSLSHKVDSRSAALPRPFKKRIAEAKRDLKEETENYLNNGNMSRNFSLVRNEKISSLNVKNLGNVEPISNINCVINNMDNHIDFSEIFCNPILLDELAKNSIGNDSLEESLKFEANFVGESSVKNSGQRYCSNSLNYKEDMNMIVDEGEVKGYEESDVDPLKIDCKRLIGEKTYRVGKSFEFKQLIDKRKDDDVYDEMESMNKSFCIDIQQFSFNGRKLIPHKSINYHSQLPIVGVKPASHIINAKVMKTPKEIDNANVNYINHENITLNTPISEIIRNYEDKINVSFNQEDLKKTQFVDDLRSSYVNLLKNKIGFKDSFSLATPVPEHSKHGDGDLNTKNEVVHISGLKIYVGGGGDRSELSTSGEKIFDTSEALFCDHWLNDDEDNDDIRQL